MGKEGLRVVHMSWPLRGVVGQAWDWAGRCWEENGPCAKTGGCSRNGKSPMETE